MPEKRERAPKNIAESGEQEKHPEEFCFMNLLSSLQSLFCCEKNRPEGTMSHPDPMVLSVHVPKTAGTTFRFVLQALHRDRLKFDYGAGSPLTNGLIRHAFYEGDRGGDSAVMLRDAYRSGRVSCIHGHFPASRYYPVFPGAEVIFWSRDPVERVISEFFHHRRYRHPGNPVNRLVHEGYVNIWQFAKLEEARNVQSRMLDGVPPENISFIGVCECFEDSIQAFARRNRMGIDASSVKSWNRNGKKPLLNDPELRAYIRDLNREDQRLHETALNKYKS
jgi:hypothetical protein